MDIRIEEQEGIILVGLSYYGDPFESSAGWTEENEIGRLWQRFMDYLGNREGFMREFNAEEKMFEVHIEHDETALKGFYEVFVGFEVPSLEGIPVDLLVKILPRTEYVIFTLYGKEISSDWHQMIYKDWLPGSGYKITHSYSYQLYDARFKGVDNIEESILDVYVPITAEEKSGKTSS